MVTTLNMLTLVYGRCNYLSHGTYSYAVSMDWNQSREFITIRFVLSFFFKANCSCADVWLLGKLYAEMEEVITTVKEHEWAHRIVLL